VSDDGRRCSNGLTYYWADREKLGRGVSGDYPLELIVRDVSWRGFNFTTQFNIIISM
jgi:hypothetical protein